MINQHPIPDMSNQGNITIKEEDIKQQNKEIQIFKDITIFFPCVTINLTKQRSQILATQFIKRGGTAYLPDSVNKNNAAIKHNYLIASKEVKLQQLRQSVEKYGLTFKEFHKKIVSDQWITQSIKVKNQLPVQPFLLFLKVSIDQFNDPTLFQTKNEVQCAKQEVKNELMNDHMQIYGTYQFNKPKLESQSICKMDEYVKKEMKVEFEGREDILAQKIKKREKAFFGLFSKNKHLLDYNWNINDNECQDEDTQKYQVKQQKQEYTLNDIDLNDSFECIVLGNQKSKKQMIKESLFNGLELPEKKIKFEEFSEGGLIDRDNRYRREEEEEDVSQNDVIVRCLQKLQKGYEIFGDKGRNIACKKAINYIRELNFQIKGPEDIFDIKMIGKKMRSHILEILKTGKLRRADSLTKVLNNPTINSFSQLSGVGLSKAVSLYQKGMTNFTKLRSNQHLLNKKQQESLMLFEINKLRIPREECEYIIGVIKQCVDVISDQKDIFEMVPCGSYRRGSLDSDDVVVILTRKDGHPCNWFMIRLTRYLQTKLIKEYLGEPTLNSDGSQFYIGTCQISPDRPYRKIEVKQSQSIIHLTNSAMQFFTTQGLKGLSITLNSQLSKEECCLEISGCSLLEREIQLIQDNKLDLVQQRRKYSKLLVFNM